MNNPFKRPPPPAPEQAAPVELTPGTVAQAREALRAARAKLREHAARLRKLRTERAALATALDELMTKQAAAMLAEAAPSELEARGAIVGLATAELVDLSRTADSLALRLKTAERALGMAEAELRRALETAWALELRRLADAKAAAAEAEHARSRERLNRAQAEILSAAERHRETELAMHRAAAWPAESRNVANRAAWIEAELALLLGDTMPEAGGCSLEFLAGEEEAR